MKELININGLIIKRMYYIVDPDYDDRDCAVMKFNDGSKLKIKSVYGGYTGKSRDEYPCFIKFIHEK
jgi:hypothetical protein